MQQSQRRGSAKPAAPNEQPTDLGIALIRSKYENVAVKDTASAAPTVDYVTRLEERAIDDINHSLRGELKTHLNVEADVGTGITLLTTHLIEPICTRA